MLVSEHDSNADVEIATKRFGIHCLLQGNVPFNIELDATQGMHVASHADVVYCYAALPEHAL